MTTLPEIDSVKQFDPSSISDEEVIQVSSLGEGLKLVAKTVVELTPSKAEEILTKDVFGPDRALDEAHVNKLINAMKRGTFRPEQVQLITCTYKGKEYRMNGQHTCWARYFLGEPKYRCPVELLRYRAESEDDMRMLYASIDRAKPRTKSNIINSYLYESDAFPDYKKSVIKMLAEGLSLYLWDTNKQTKHDGDEVAFLMKTEYLELSLKVGEFFKKIQSERHLRRSPVYAAMFFTFSKNAGAAAEFWEAVRTGVNLQANDPCLRLRNHLMSHAVNAGRGGGAYKSGVPAEEMLGWCIQAWNAHREGNELKVFRSAKERIKPK